jgi:hypothetical protein
LTEAESIYLYQLTQSERALIYRATRDGFKASSFHSKCDSKAKTITIIKTKDNYVFGGYTAASWDRKIGYKTDMDAYIYGLMRNGVFDTSKYNISEEYQQNAIYGEPSYGPTFGGEHTIHICDRSNVNRGSYTHGENGNYSGLSSNTYLANG